MNVSIDREMKNSLTVEKSVCYFRVGLQFLLLTRR